LKATEEELKEVMAIAMTVGATKIRMLHENALASFRKEVSSRTQSPGEQNTPADAETCTA
jgi:transcription initiation factor IIE alpha subunit